MKRKIEIASGAGFCNGVKRAVDMALELAKKYGKIYTLGELVHNELVTAYLFEHGAECVSVEDIGKLKAGDTVLIRAHGVPVELERSLKEKGLNVFDATCPVVKRNQNIAKEQSEMGRRIIIYGDKTHDEVVGLISYCRGGATILSPDKMPEIGDEPTAILFQTTVLDENFEKISKFVENFKKNSQNLVEIFNTICYTTKAKQSEAVALAEKNQAVLVLGSSTSANTRRLFEVARAKNENTFFIQNAEEFLQQAKNFKDFQSVSIVAGASTPPSLIREVSELMSETQHQAEVATETEVTKEATLQEQTAPQEDAKANANEDQLTMADIMKSNHTAHYVEYKVGRRVLGKVLSATPDGVYVAIGGKKDGFIDKSEATVDGNYNPTDFEVGKELMAVIIDTKGTQVTLSKKAVDVKLLEEAEAEKALSQSEFRLKMTEVVKGGLRGHLGSYTIFVPASQIRMGYVSNLEDYKDKELRLTLMPEKQPEAKKEVVENAENAESAEPSETAETTEPATPEKPKKKSKYLFASQRMILEREKKEREDAFWNSIHVHDIVTGKVKRFTNFGAFVSVKGYDCLAHVSELSWNRVSDPSTVLKIGESYDFVVLKLDRESGKISLGYKQLQKKPYELAAEKFPVGSVVKGKVERIFPFGAFVSIDDGVDGLVHISQISHNWVKDANEVFTVGQEIEAKIIGFDENRITLSMKELLPPPEQTETSAEEISEATDEEKQGRRNSRMKKFEQKVADGEGRRERKPGKKDASSNEPKEWVSGSGTASIGDLFKGLNLDLPDDTQE